MYLDDLISGLERGLWRRRINENRVKGVLIKNSPLNYVLKETHLNILKDEAKCFSIDEATLDSLYNLPHTNIDYEKSIRLPFPFIFFEFEKPLKTETIDWGKKELGGMLYYKSKDMARLEDKNIESKLGKESLFKRKYSITPDRFELVSFYSDDLYSENPVVDGHHIHFDISNLPNLIISTIKYNYLFDYEAKEFFKTRKESEEDGNIETSEKTKINVSPAVLRSTRKEVDLMINLINYLNAQNVVYRRIRRESNIDGNNQDIERINRKRKKKGKRPLPIQLPLKPYYLIEIKKSYVDEEGPGEKTWELQWRVWVRGHFRHYKSGKCDWIEHHIKGPTDAPWKHNRYEVLYKNFRHLLRRRGNEQI